MTFWVISEQEYITIAINDFYSVLLWFQFLTSNIKLMTMMDLRHHGFTGSKIHRMNNGDPGWNSNPQQ